MFWESYVGVKCCYKGGNYLTLFGESRSNMLIRKDQSLQDC